jgi:hypothetical protein
MDVSQRALLLMSQQPQLLSGKDGALPGRPASSTQRSTTAANADHCINGVYPTSLPYLYPNGWPTIRSRA